MMFRRLRTGFLLVLALSATVCPHPGSAATTTPGPSESILLDTGWQFYRFDDGAFELQALPSRGWSDVVLPHTARIEPRIVNDQWQGDALYRRVLVAETGWKGRAVWLRFEGAMTVATVYLNGKQVAHHLGGYLPFTVDLSQHLRWGEANQLLVHLDNRDNPIVGPKPLEILDFNTYGGLYRDVRLLVRDSLHITDEALADQVAGGGVFVTYPEVSTDKARVEIKTHVENTGTRSRRFEIRHRLIHGANTVAAVSTDPFVLQAAGDLSNTSYLVVEKPRLWSPQSPGLYTLVTEVSSGGAVVDRREQRIGIRRIEIDRDGFTINGKKMFLRGVNRHQEYPYVGYATSAAADYRDARLIKEAGFDYVRLSHYPHSRHFMRAADELGLVLIDAILGWQYYNPDPRFSEQVVETCRNLIRRDRNHPSVIAWECSLNESAMPGELVSALHRAVHEEYPGDQAYSAGWISQGYDIFLQARQHRIEHYGVPGQPYVVSEYGDWEYYAKNAGLEQDEWQDLKEEERTSRQLIDSGEKRLLQQATNIQEAHNDNFSVPAFADGYWVMFDYNRGYADDLEASGIMSIDRLPKFSWYFFRSQRPAAEQSSLFASGPMVAIASYWEPASNSRVRVYSNAETVELLINGASQGRQGPDENRISDKLAHPPFTFNTGGFEEGGLEARAYIAGVEVARTTVRTPGPAEKLEVSIATMGVAVTASDIVFVRAALKDRNGTLVRSHPVTVEFNAGCEASVAWIAGPKSVQSEAGVASALLRVLDPSKACSISASTGSLTGRAELNGQR